MTPYRDPRPPRGSVTRKPAHTLGLIVAALVLAALSAGLGLVALGGGAVDPFLPGLGAMLAGVGAVGLVVGRLLGGSGEAPCPACGALVRDVERKGEIQGILCTGCRRFLRSRDGVLRAMRKKAVADSPLFGAAVTRHVAWPPGCVVCGAPPTQSVPLSIFGADVAARAAISAYGQTGGIVIVGEDGEPEVDEPIQLDAPHCAITTTARASSAAGPRASCCSSALSPTIKRSASSTKSKRPSHRSSGAAA